MNYVVLPLNQGEVSSRDPSALDDGELKQSVGVEYLPGDTERAWKLRGRTSFGDTGSSADIRGLVLCKFDSGGEDKLLAMTSSSILAADPGDVGEFSSLTGGRSPVSSNLTAAHFNDRWFLTTGADHNSVLEADGTFRDMGMVAPVASPTVSVSAFSSVTNRPTAHVGAAINPANAYDANVATFSTVTRTTAGTTQGVLSGFSPGTQANRRMTVRWWLVSDTQYQAIRTGSGVVRDFFVEPYKVVIIFDRSQDGGQTWSNALTETFTGPGGFPQELQINIDGGGTSIDSDQVQLRYQLKYISGEDKVSTLRVYDCKIVNGSTNNAFDATAVKYAVAEFDDVRGLQSPVSEASEPVAFIAASNHNGATVTLPTAQNDNSTHWLIYKTPDNGTTPQQLGLVGKIGIGEATWVDDFDLWPATDQPTPTVPLKQIFYKEDLTSELLVDPNTPPPRLEYITSFQGRLVGVLGRSIYYSEAGLPESWPGINQVGSFPMPDRDELVACVQVGPSLLVGATELMFMLDTLPEIVANRFTATPPRPLSGQPGLVSSKALLSFSITGESRGAWVSRFGIHMTNGSLTKLLTMDIDWDSKVSQANLSTAVLGWDRRRQALVFAYDRPDGSRRWALLHMAPEHEKSNGMPKITWDHYGEITSIVGGEVDGVYRLYSGHKSDGTVYLEDSGDTDASNAYNDSGAIPFVASPGDQYFKWSEFGVNRGNVRHNNAGIEQHLRVDVAFKRDSSGNTQSVSKTVQLDDRRGTGFLVNRSGEMMSMTLTHVGKARINLRDVRLDVEPMGEAGKVR